MKSEKLKRQQKTLFGFFYSLLIVFLLITGHWSPATGEIRDRVVAFVDNTAITLSELEETYAQTLRVTPDIKKDEVLNTMVNRLLLVKEAKKIKLEAPSEDELLKEYIDLRIRAFIRIKEEEIEDFYKKHINEFQGKEFEAVRDEIENYLTEKELNERLKLHINELMEKACIKIQLSRDFETKTDSGD
ncbi:MAG: hypothetical protein A2Z47_06625 [Thermodesulfovibrio sp. RBG_19FT_COMBO_42_12]|nr:MAG: hypothetical protein A2Z47_06625 [Thermodesulfovibrio sp. RBG_19FT_COMBO_42_12]